MASVILQSHLTLDEQSARLCTYVAAGGSRLDDRAAQTICRVVRLDEPAAATALARRLKTALAAHGIGLSHQAALEAIAKLCGSSSWMRARQGRLPLSTPEIGPQLYVQVLRNGEEQGAFESCDSLVSVADRVLETVKADWPDACVGAQCTINLGPQAIAIELEHPTACWLSFRVWLLQFDGTTSPTILDLRQDQVLSLVGRLERTLEQSHPGMVVLNAIRSQQLPFWYHFVPTLTQPESGYSRECSGDVELLALLDALGASINSSSADDLTLGSKDGPLQIKPVWASVVKNDEVEHSISAAQVRHLLNRVARLRRVAGRSLTSLFSMVFTGEASAEGFQQLNRRLVDERIQALGIGIPDLVTQTGLPLNAILRIRKYGWAHVSHIRMLADALEVQDLNALLTDDEDGLAFRIEKAEVFVKALEDTHLWAQIIGDGIGAGEREEVEAASECLREYVELIQFSRGPFAPKSRFDDPMDEKSLLADIQAQLDDLARHDIAVLVDRGIRFPQRNSRLTSLHESPFIQNTLYFEKVSHLRHTQ